MFSAMDAGEIKMFIGLVIMILVILAALGVEWLLDWYGEKHKDEID